MIERTVEIEAQLGGNPTYLDLFKGTDLRRTLITCFAYASQNFAGNLIANQATFFFERASSSLLYTTQSRFLADGQRLACRPTSLSSSV
jgi:SP family general alpha glucoside:H+ symporter-like MFS transporter